VTTNDAGDDREQAITEQVVGSFAAGDDYLTDDAVFGVKDSLIDEFVEHPARGHMPSGFVPPGAPTDTAWCSLSYQFVLASQGRP
jgi:hydroxyquinol 1,2-dioxygenase